MLALVLTVVAQKTKLLVGYSAVSVTKRFYWFWRGKDIEFCRAIVRFDCHLNHALW